MRRLLVALMALALLAGLLGHVATDPVLSLKLNRLLGGSAPATIRPGSTARTAR